VVNVIAVFERDTAINTSAVLLYKKLADVVCCVIPFGSGKPSLPSSGARPTLFFVALTVSLVVLLFLERVENFPYRHAFNGFFAMLFGVLAHLLPFCLAVSFVALGSFLGATNLTPWMKPRGLFRVFMKIFGSSWEWFLARGASLVLCHSVMPHTNAEIVSSQAAALSAFRSVELDYSSNYIMVAA
jgi:hypothetical protein